MCSRRQIVCVFLATVVVSATAVSRQVRINQANSIEATPQEILQENEAAGNASYEFAYDVNDPLSNDVKSHREIRDGENVYGYYTFKEADGSTRVVNYKVGPKTGFEATVERLELGERPEIKKPDASTLAPQEARDNNVRVDQRRLRGRTQGRPTPPPARNPYPDNQRINTYSKPPGVQVNQHVQATAPEYEYYTYIQDEKPLPKSKVDDLVRRPSRPVAHPVVTDVPTGPNVQADQEWKNSVVGRKHIRQQIALLAKKKEEEEAQKAQQEQARQQETTLPPVTEQASTEQASPSTSPASKEEKPEGKEGEKEEEEEKGYDDKGFDDDEYDFHDDHEDEEEEEE